MKRACHSCAFFDGAAGDERGTCRRNAPRSHLVSADVDPDEMRVRGVWPVVAAEDWCGQFEKRKFRG
jgi:hypothetical protein